MRKSKVVGFSLIELSVVMIVIGILVIGITQGSRIITEAKLKSAKSLTQSSPVVSTEGLVLWLDTVRDLGLENNSSSFQLSNNDTVKNWYSINSQLTNSTIIANQSTQANQPVYVKNGINGLPSLLFDGTVSSRHLAITNSSTISPTTAITIFAVVQPFDTAPSIGGIICKEVSSGISNPPYVLYVSGGNISFAAAQGSNSTSSSSSLPFQVNNAYIARGYVTNNQAYVNVNSSAGSAGAAKSLLFSSTGPLRIGQQKNTTNRFFNGYISEIIMFNRALKNAEINGINQYLSSKYGIKL